MKKNIAVVMGGYSSEYEVSMKSGTVILENLSKERYNLYQVILTRQAWTVHIDGKNYPIDLNHFCFELDGQTITFDAVFNAIHGTPGEDGPLAGYFELLNLPQTGSGQFPSALTFNKSECNILLKDAGLNVPPARYLLPEQGYDSSEIIEELGLPCFVKANRSGSSIGVTKVKTTEELPGAIEKAFAIDDRVVIEGMIGGTECCCGVTNHSGNIEALAVTDIVPQNEFFDYESKYSGLSEEITPARINSGTYGQIMEESEFIYEYLGLNGLARMDFIINEHNVPFLIEVNTIPGLSAASLLPKQAAYTGISLGELFDQTLEKTLKSTV